MVCCDCANVDATFEQPAADNWRGSGFYLYGMFSAAGACFRTRRAWCCVLNLSVEGCEMVWFVLGFLLVWVLLGNEDSM